MRRVRVSVLDDAEEERRPALGGDELAWVVRGLEYEREGTLQLTDNLHDELPERDAGVELLVEVLGELRDHLGVRLGLEDEALALEHLPQRLVVGDDAVVHHEELVGGVRCVGVAVAGCRGTVRRPARVSDAAVVLEEEIAVQVLLAIDVLGEPVDLAGLLEDDGLELVQGRAVVDGDTR